MAWIRRFPVPAAYLVLALIHVSLVAAADNVKNPLAAGIALAIALVVILGVVPFRRRWAWWIDLVIHVVALVLIVFESVKLLGWGANVIELGLLLSPQMRGFISERRPHKFHPSDQPTVG